MNSAFNRSEILNLYVVKQAEVTRFVFDCPFDALLFWSLGSKQFRYVRQTIIKLPLLSLDCYLWITYNKY